MVVDLGLARRTATGPKLNVSLGQEFGDYLGVAAGDRVFLMRNPEKPGTIVIVSTAVMNTILEKGWSAV